MEIKKKQSEKKDRIRKQKNSADVCWCNQQTEGEYELKVFNLLAKRLKTKFSGKKVSQKQENRDFFSI